MLAHHELRTRTRRHPLRLYPDRTTRATLVGMGDADQRIGLLAALAADRRPTLEPEVCPQAYVGTDCALASDDFARDGLNQPLYSRRRGHRGKNVERRF